MDCKYPSWHSTKNVVTVPLNVTHAVVTICVPGGLIRLGLRKAKALISFMRSLSKQHRFGAPENKDLHDTGSETHYNAGWRRREVLLFSKLGLSIVVSLHNDTELLLALVLHRDLANKCILAES